VLPAVRPAVGATEPAPPGSVDGPTPRPSAGPPLTPDGSAVLSVATPADPSGPSLALAVAPVVAAAIVLTLIAAGFSVRASLAKVD
jgi:hypothetical protein